MNKKLHNLEEYNENFLLRYKRNVERSIKTGIECPTCVGEELVSLDPGIVLTSLPPQRWVVCNNCKKSQLIYC